MQPGLLQDLTMQLILMPIPKMLMPMRMMERRCPDRCRQLSFPGGIGGREEGRDPSPLSPASGVRELGDHLKDNHLLLLGHGEEDEGKLDDVGDDLGLHALKLHEFRLIRGA